MIYGYNLFVVGGYLLVRGAFELPRVYKKQVLVIDTATLVPLAGNVLYPFGLTRQIDFAPLTFSFTVLVAAWALHYKLFGSCPWLIKAA